MAFADTNPLGTHVEFGYAGAYGGDGTDVSIMSGLTASETLSGAAVTSKRAPSHTNHQGRPFVRIQPVIDIWVTIGADPADPALAASTRHFVKEQEMLERFVLSGDRVRVAPA